MQLYAPRHSWEVSRAIQPWLQTRRTIPGLRDAPSPGGSNPHIVDMAHYVGDTFPPQNAYAQQYQTDDTAWCGVAAAYCLATCHPPISGPFGPTDTDRWMWADSFRTSPLFTNLGGPIKGCIVVMNGGDGN